MACGKFLDLQGLETFYKKLKTYIDNKVSSSGSSGGSSEVSVKFTNVEIEEVSDATTE